MTIGWLDHKQLMIIKGVGKTPTDNNSAENDPVVFPLMSGPVSLTANGWTPQIASVKSGGVWADSPISDGRTLLAAPSGNVIEKIEIIITDSSYLGVMKQLDTLNKMAQDCRNFWQTQVQIDPVYLAWAAGCNNPPLPQYALLYNIEVASEFQDSNPPSIRATLTLEREPFWRGIPPGANPKLWAFYVNNQQIGTNKVLADATLVTGSDHLITQTIANKAEWTPAAYGLQSTFLSQNFIDISKSLVPGDAPALVEMSISGTLNAFANIYIGRSSKKQSGIGHDSVNRVNSYILNVGDGVPDNVTKTVGAVTNGVLSNGSAVNYYYGSRTSTGIDANFLTSVRWSENVPTGIIKLDREFFRGTFAIFCRCRNASGTPTLADMRIRVLIEEFENNAANQYLALFTSPEANPPIDAVGNGRYLTYMGTVTIPFENRAVVSPLGYGIQLQETRSNLYVSIQQKVDVATANRIFEVMDLIFMPLDEALTQLVFTFQTASSTSVALLDNTGYFSRGIDPSVLGYITNVETGGVSQEARGQSLTLIPNTDQRLYFLSDGFAISAVPSSSPNQALTVRLNIVPRWSSIRDT